MPIRTEREACLAAVPDERDEVEGVLLVLLLRRLDLEGEAAVEAVVHLAHDLAAGDAQP